MPHQQSDPHAPGTTPSAAPSAVQLLLDRAVADGGIPGIIAEARDSAGGWFARAGVADVAAGAPRMRGDRFRIGSLTKALTATVVLQMVAEGRLSLESTPGSLIPGVLEDALGMDGHAVTVRELLNHTSGIPDVLPGQQPTPGERGRFRYSKVNYTLAGMIVESLTDTSLAQQIASRISRPLGLKATSLPVAETGIDGPHARHYTQGPDGQLHDVTDADVSWAGAAGGAISTLDDVHVFLGALLGGRLLPTDVQQQMLTTVPTEDWIPRTRYGLGIFTQRLPSGADVWGGGGAIDGSWTYAMGNHDGTHLLVSNVNGDWGDPIAVFTTLLDAEFGHAPAQRSRALHE